MTKKAPQAFSFMPNDEDEDIMVKTLAPRTRFILLAGRPLNEPIANYGPFVLNSQEQL